LQEIKVLTGVGFDHLPIYGHAHQAKPWDNLHYIFGP